MSVRRQHIEILADVSARMIWQYDMKLQSEHDQQMSTDQVCGYGYTGIT